MKKIGIILALAGAGFGLWLFTRAKKQAPPQSNFDPNTSLLNWSARPTPELDLAQPGAYTTPGINSLFDLLSPQGTTKSFLDSLLGSNTLNNSAPGGGATNPFSQPYLSADIGGGTGYIMKAWTTPKPGDTVVYAMGEQGTRTEKAVFDGFRWEPQFQDASIKYGIPAGVLSRLAWQESRYNPTALSIVGARGMMQIMPATLPNIPIENLNNPAKAIYYAASILADNYKRFKDWPKAIVAYNQGGGNVNKAIKNATAKNEPGNWLNNPPIGPDGRGYIGIARDTGLYPSLINTSSTGVA